MERKTSTVFNTVALQCTNDYRNGVHVDEPAQPNTLARVTYRRVAFLNTLKSKVGLMVRGRQRSTSYINNDGCPIPTKKRWRKSNKLCDSHILSAACAPNFHLPITWCREWP